MGWPQITWLVMAGASLGMSLAMDGKPKTGKHSFFVTLFSLAIYLSILRAGGFFS